MQGIYDPLNKIDLSRVMFEIDGVLCEKPDIDIIDDSKMYISFIKEAEALFIPSCTIYAIVTQRHEKYRKETEDWLKNNNICYQELIMMPDNIEWTLQNISLYKSMYYFDSDAILLVESDIGVATTVNKNSNLRIYCVSNGLLYDRDTSIDVYLNGKQTEKKLSLLVDMAFVYIHEIKKNIILQPEKDISRCVNMDDFKEFLVNIRQIVYSVSDFAGKEDLKDIIDDYCDRCSELVKMKQYRELTDFILEYDFSSIENNLYLLIYNKMREFASSVCREVCNIEETRNLCIRTKRIYYDKVQYPEHQAEMDYLFDNSDSVYLGKFVDKYDEDSIEVEYDEKAQMCYAYHNEKRLYFCTESIDVAKKYYNGILVEQDKDCPHKYYSDTVSCDDCDVFVDVGAAEGFAALEMTEKANTIYVMECEEKWQNALKCTFEKYSDKTYLIPKYAGLEDNDTTTTLDTLLENYSGKNITIKLDVEGMAVEVLRGAIKTLENNNCKVVCAAYHYHSELEDLKKFFERINYNYEISNGFMAFNCVYHVLQCGKYERYEEIDFRHGVIRAYKGY